MAKRLRSIPPVIPHYPPDNDRGAYAPQLWYGDEAVNAADGPWYDAPPGSIYVQGGTTTGALYSKVADTGTAGDWQALAASGSSVTGYNVRDYGATGDGSTDDTTAIAAAITALPAGSGRLRFPAGTYVCSIELPDHPKTVILEGDGPYATILQAKAANTPIIQGCPTVTSGIGTPKHIVRDLGLKAHASGSTGAAVQGNMSWHIFENIDFYDNGTGKFTYGFLLTDDEQHCYANTFTHIRVYHQDGPTDALFKVENSANLQWFDHIFVSNGTTATGPAVVFDLPATGYGEAYYITNGHFEGVPGDIVVPAMGTWVMNCYFEDIKAGKYVVDGGSGRDQYLVYLIGNKFGGSTGDQFSNAGNYVYIANRGVTISGVNGGLSMGVHNSTIAQQVAATAVAEIWSNTGYAGELRLNQSGVKTWTLRNTATTGVLQFDNGDPARVTLEADGKLMANVGLGVGATAEVANLTTAGVILNDGGADADTRIEGDGDQFLVMADASTDRLGVGVQAPAAKLHVDQSSATGAVPPLLLDQADVSEEMLELTTTVGEGNAIEAAGTKVLTTTHYIKATITGVGPVYIPCGTIATP